jgi:hypothetical protein
MLIDDGLVLASGAIEPGEARAGALVVVAETPTRAVATSFVAVSIEGILASRTLLQIARWTSVSGVADTSNVLHGIPWCCIDATSLVG